MNPSIPQGGQPGPLSPGDVVSAALRLYKDRFRTYLHLALLATLWLIGGIFGLVLAIALLAGVGAAVGGQWGAIAGGMLGLLAGVGALLYGSAQYYALSGVIGRLSFRDLINQPETSLEARRQVTPRLAQFLSLGFLLLLAYIAAYVAAVLGALVAGGGIGLLVGGLFAALIGQNFGTVVGVVLGTVVGTGVFVVVLIRVISRLFISEVVLAIEPRLDAGTSLGRSWQLTQAAVGRIQVVFLAAFLIQLPIVSLTNYIPSILLELLPQESIAYGILVGANVLLSLLGSMLVLPLWQAVKGVLYYDLRSRREGLDLSLRQGDGEGG